MSFGVEKRRTEVGAVLDFSAQNYRFFRFPPNKLTKKTRFERRLIAFDRFIYQKFKPHNDFLISFYRDYGDESLNHLRREIKRFRSAKWAKSNLFELCHGEKTSDVNRTNWSKIWQIRVWWIWSFAGCDSVYGNLIPWIISNSTFGSYDSLYIFFYDYPQSYHQSFEYHAETQSAQRCFLPTYCFAHAETRHNGARPQRPADSYAWKKVNGKGKNSATSRRNGASLWAQTSSRKKYLCALCVSAWDS